VILFDNRVVPPFPNIYTLIPTCGATLIILFGEKNTFIGYLLSTRLLRWIGLISYSAYLWHQPLLAFIRLHSDQTSPDSIVIIVVSAVFLLSILSYYFVEQPFRNKKRFSRNQIFTMAGLSTVITLIIALFLIETADNRSLMTKGDDPYLFDLKNYGSTQYLIRNFVALAAKKKSFSNESSTINRRIMLIGDSYAEDFYNMVIEGKHLKNYEFCAYFMDARCQIYLGDEDPMKFIEAKFRQLCINAKINDLKYALPMIRQANMIFVIAKWALWSAQRLPNTLKLLNLTKEQRVFVFGAKHFGGVNPMLYVNKSKQFRIKQFQYPKLAIIQANRLLEKTIDKSNFINVQKMVCNGFNQTCPLFTPQGKLITYDGAHLTKYGARYIGDIIFKNKPLNELK
jgi:hypothetical protein